MSLLRYFGLARPYRFERGIPAFLAVVLLAIVAVAAAALGTSGLRGIYFAWLAGLLVAALLVVRWPWLATALIALAALDLCWGLFAPPLLPPLKDEPQRFRWHALLQVVPIPALQVTSSSGLKVSHTSQGTRGREPSAADIEGRAIVATFGGSSTYDIGVGEGDTWSDRLAEGVGRDRIFVVNEGVPGYTTVEHVLQAAFYPAKFGRLPRCAIYYVGWNDLRNAFIPDLDPGYADFHLPSQVDSLKVRRIGGAHVTFSPLLTTLARIASAEIDTVRYSADPRGEPGRGDDAGLTALYERNLRTISAINRRRGVTTIWVDQLVNRAQLAGEGRYGWLPLVRDRDVWPMLQHFNDALGRVAKELDDVHVTVPIESFGEADFVDNGHFSAAGARRFAAALVPVVRERCR